MSLGDWAIHYLRDHPPVPGYYRARIRPYCPWVGVRIWLDVPRDDDGRIADRPRRLACTVNGQWHNVFDIWPRCREISQEEYESLVANPPDDPLSPVKPRRKSKEPA